MVDAVGVVELRGAAQAGAPPGVVVALQRVPAVGGEAPVLAGVAEHVRRGAGAVVEVEEAASAPDVGAVLAQQDRHVALEPDAGLLQPGHGRGELPFGDPLDPRVKERLVAVGLPGGVDLAGLRVAQLGPGLPGAHPLLLLQAAEDGVGADPRVGLQPLGEIRVGLDGVDDVPVVAAQDVALEADRVQPGDPGVVRVHLREGLDRGALRRGEREVLQADVDGMEREGGERAVGRPLLAGVVDREQLDQVHAAALRPLREGDEVRELADSARLLRAQRAQRDGDARLEPIDLPVSHLPFLPTGRRARRARPRASSP